LISGVGGLGNPTGSVTITADTLMNGTINATTGTLTSVNPVYYGGSDPGNNQVRIQGFEELTLQGAFVWHFEGNAPHARPDPLIFPVNPLTSVGVKGQPLWVLSAAEQAGTLAIQAAQAAAIQAAAEEAANTFGTDSVAEQIEYGFAGDVGTLPPMDHRLQGVGISVPYCFNESREGEECISDTSDPKK
jgi:hypothetical protein